jgi:hypothetical protein
LPQVYGLIAELEGAAPGNSASVSAEPAEQASNGSGSSWTPELIERAYVQSPPAMQRILEKLADQPGTEIVSDDLAKAIGPGAAWPNLAGTLGAFGRRTKSRYKQASWPFQHRWDHDREKMVYSMTEDIAQIIKNV